MDNGELDFKTIHKTYGQRIRLYLEKLAGISEAEDLTQETFVKVSRSLSTFRGESSLSTWIYRIATNTALDRIRKQQLSEAALSLDAAGEMADKNLWTGELRSIDQQVIRKEMNDCIRNVVASLPDIYRTIIVLSELEGFKNEEIAQILGVSLETVKMRMHRARAKLKEELAKHCILYHDDRNVLSCDLKSKS